MPEGEDELTFIKLATATRNAIEWLLEPHKKQNEKREEKPKAGHERERAPEEDRSDVENGLQPTVRERFRRRQVIRRTR